MESCVFSLDKGIGECGIEEEKKKRERLCRMMRRKKSRETKSKSQNVWFDVCIPSIKRNAHFVDR